jgi:hypothetical protein
MKLFAERAFFAVSRTPGVPQGKRGAWNHWSGTGPGPARFDSLRHHGRRAG